MRGPCTTSSRVTSRVGRPRLPLVCRHFEALWFANVANAILWWAFVKAWWRALITRLCCCCSRMVRLLPGWAASHPDSMPILLASRAAA